MAFSPARVRLDARLWEGWQGGASEMLGAPHASPPRVRRAGGAAYRHNARNMPGHKSYIPRVITRARGHVSNSDGALARLLEKRNHTVEECIGDGARLSLA